MVSALPAEYLDPDTPPEVVVTDQIRPLVTDSTLGVPLGAPGPGLPAVPDPPRHQLVTVGDSLTHGMSSGAVFHTDLSWPALVARSLGVDLAVPTYGGPLDGLPLNIEKLLRDLQGRFGNRLNLLEMAPAAARAPQPRRRQRGLLGTGRRQPPATHRSALRERRHLRVGRARCPVLDHGAGSGQDRQPPAARRPARGQAATTTTTSPPRPSWPRSVPRPPRSTRPPPTVTTAASARWWWCWARTTPSDRSCSKNVAWSGTGNSRAWTARARTPSGTRCISRPSTPISSAGCCRSRRAACCWPPCRTSPSRRSLTGSTPTSPGKKWREGSRYFPYYTDPWIAEKDFRPDKHRHITHQQARAIDSAIDQYNDDHPRPRPPGPRRRPRLAPGRPVRDPRRRRVPPLPRRRHRGHRTAGLAALPSARPHRRPRYPLLPLGRNRAAPGGPVRPGRRPPHHCRIRHHRPGRPRRPQRRRDTQPRHRLHRSCSPRTR